MPALLINDVPIECINQAAISYYVPAALIISVLRTEGGRNGMAKSNKNGTFDYGPMQINTLWLDKIKSFGYTAHDLQFNPCKNVEVGTWILSQ
ncbi:MAG: trbN, partial [Gammaproteobacteria bacterium]|nr:trbN [Gammaproteobacteria bacterium]